MVSVTAGGLSAKKGQEKGILLVVKVVAIIRWTESGISYLSCSTISDKHKLEARNLRGSFRHFIDCFSLFFAIEFGRALQTRWTLWWSHRDFKMGRQGAV